jgi:hypothetical protein
MSFMADGDYQTGTRKAMMLESYRGSRGRKS